ncbi:polynucleotide adenylyltransferase PcnB [Aquisalimonas lutea]|uniref:polynucleotide adenylyltransferase PcnB n=1 Tax=Aquisalimonas lutea TaxID=1327750 RepID=UPI0025B52304|nr:polynucleotide adenylyltransferase PcnB [Aquisalimonas lutea]MDN3519286.1 polynucleotide adenylyltransferase PcnB [Aquisalimonas lutea]
MTEQELDDLRARIRVIPREEHRISRKDISDNALKVLYRLKNAGFEAYLVGGGVRDLSLGREPKDFDVVTDARPEDVRDLFRNCRLIGRRFRLAHVHFGREIIEVATFRALHDPESVDAEGDVEMEDGRILRDNVYGSVEEDAFRRDFTINSLYYNIADFSVVDFANGLDDLDEGRVRLIGDPATRYREDPVRMLRAARFAAKLGFRIDADTGAPIPEMAGLLDHIPQARLFDEIMKLFMAGVATETYAILRRYGLFSHLFPQADEALDGDKGEVWDVFILRALENTDRRVNEGKPVTPAFLFAALLWPSVSERAEEFAQDTEVSPAQALQEAMAEVVERQLERVAIPKRFSIPMREIMLLQSRLERFRGKRARRLLGHPRFRAAYDFLLIRAAAGDAPQELADTWTRMQDADGTGEADGAAAAEAPRRRKRRRRRGKSGRASPETPE